MTNDGYENLANAIILQAVKDYRKAMKIIKRQPRNKDALEDKAECERFFLSKWFITLTNIDGKVLIEKLKKEV